MNHLLFLLLLSHPVGQERPFDELLISRDIEELIRLTTTAAAETRKICREADRVEDLHEIECLERFLPAARTFAASKPQELGASKERFRLEYDAAEESGQAIEARRLAAAYAGYEERTLAEIEQNRQELAWAEVRLKELQWRLRAHPEGGEGLEPPELGPKRDKEPQEEPEISEQEAKSIRKKAEKEEGGDN